MAKPHYKERDKLIGFRATKEEDSFLKEEAKINNCSVSEYVRGQLFGSRKTPSPGGPKADISSFTTQLSRLVDICKQYPSVKNLERVVQSALDMIKDMQNADSDTSAPSP